MGLLDKAKEVAKEQAANREAAAEERRAQSEGQAAAIAQLPKWEYQVKRIGEDKQKGLLGSGRMEEIFNAEGAQGWERVAINEERATFKRPKV
jgi:hypothetical protein